MAKKKEHDNQSTAFVDRIEDDIAVLILSDEIYLNIPRKELPDTVKEGDYLQIGRASCRERV
jgi:hypothetical protein